jgi:hypothetical protein
MAIYNFKKQFGGAVRTGSKTQTIRAHGKRPPPKVGDWAYCYTGLRTRDVCRLGAFRIIHVTQISISSGGRSVSIPSNGAWYRLTDDEIEQLACADGFASADEFFGFFAKEHGGTLSGHLIEWNPKDLQ